MASKKIGLIILNDDGTLTDQEVDQVRESLKHCSGNVFAYIEPRDLLLRELIERILKGSKNIKPLPELIEFERNEQPKSDNLNIVSEALQRFTQRYVNPVDGELGILIVLSNRLPATALKTLWLDPEDPDTEDYRTQKIECGLHLLDMKVPA